MMTELIEQSGAFINLYCSTDLFGSDKSSLVARYFISLQAVNINQTNLHDLQTGLLH